MSGNTQVRGDIGEYPDQGRYRGIPRSGEISGNIQVRDDNILPPIIEEILEFISNPVSIMTKSMLFYNGFFHVHELAAL